MSTWTHECSLDGTTKELEQWKSCNTCGVSPTYIDGVPFYDTDGNLVPVEQLIAERDAEDEDPEV